MLLNLPREGASSSGSELPGSSDDGLLVFALRKMMKKEVELMVISAVEKLIGPMIESLIRRVVKEEIQSAQQMLMTRGNGSRTHEATMPTESRTLQLKFLDEVSLPVLTGKEIEGKGGTAMRLAVVDNTTKQRVKSGPEASAKVEILLLQADHNDKEHDWSTEDFNNKIIRESEKEKPHVAKGMYVHLKEGEAILSDVKLGHGSSWKKRCLCRLGARFVDNFSGSMVKEAWTKSFMVEDRRGKLYGKHYPPSLLDEVWRLKKIGKDGERWKRLDKENIITVQDFLFLLSIDPQKLNRVFRGSEEWKATKQWKATVDHARTCIIDDKKIYLYSSPSKFNFDVAFDAVAQLMGIVRDSHYVQLANLSEVELASAQELLVLAFENQKDITSIDDETSLVHQFPNEPNDICVRDDENAPTEPDTSYLTIGHMCPLNNFSLIASERMQQICDQSFTPTDQGPSSSLIALCSNQALCDPSLTVPDQGPSSSPIALGSHQSLCDPSLTVPDQGPSSSHIPLRSNQTLCDPSLTVPDQSPNSSPIALGANQALRDPSFVVPDQGPSYSPIARGSCQALCEASLIVSDQGPIHSPNQALCYPSLTVLDHSPIYSPNDFGFNQALSDLLTNPNYFVEHLVDSESMISLLFHQDNNHYETCAESHSGQQSNAGGIRSCVAVGLTAWVSRVRKRVMSFGNSNVQKRPRIG